MMPKQPHFVGNTDGLGYDFVGKLDGQSGNYSDITCIRISKKEILLLI